MRRLPLNSTRPPLPTTGSSSITRPPEELDLRYEGVKRHVPPPAGAIMLVPAGSPARAALERAQGLAAHLPGARVGRAGRRRGVRPRSGAADGPPTGRLGTSPPSGGNDGGGCRTGDRRPRGTSCRRVAGQPPGRPPDPPRLGAPPAGARAGRGAAAGAAPRRGGVHRGAPRRLPDPGADGRGRPPQPLPLPRQFKAATGLPPHQYVILRRVERAKQLLQAGTDLSLAEVALHAGFSDQSQFSRHFKRLVGVTPGQFRTPSRIA